jgi:hypothetical protein
MLRDEEKFRELMEKVVYTDAMHRIARRAWSWTNSATELCDLGKAFVDKAKEERDAAKAELDAAIEAESKWQYNVCVGGVK